MKKRLIAGSVAAVAIGVGVAIAVVGPASAVLPGDAVSLLDSAPAIDAPPLGYVESFRLKPETVRYVGSTKLQQFWVAVDVDGKVCIVTAAGKPETAGAACASADVVRSSGVMLALTPDRSSGLSEYIVYLLPDTVLAAGAGGPWQTIGGNVVVADAEAARSAAVVSLERSDGGQISLVP